MATCSNNHAVPPGQAFCGVCGAPAATPAAAAGGPVPITHPTSWIIAGGAAAAIGSFLPWGTATAPFIGTVSRSGMDGGDGVFTLVLGAALLLLGMASRQAATSGTSNKRTAIIVVALILGVLVAFEASDISDRLREAEDASDLIVTSIGSGIWLLGAGVVACLIGAFVLPSSSRSTPARSMVDGSGWGA